MSEFGASVLDFSVAVTFGMLLLGMLLTLVRLWLGPSLGDRVVALDLLAFLTVAFIATLAVAWDRPNYLDVGIALALVAFLSTVAFARFAERSLRSADPDKQADVAEDGSEGGP
jgi:multicomponent Na+:H+ antiporter subunit F